MRSFLIAVRFLTRLPMPEGRPVEGRDMPGATVFFPLVGCLIGAITALVVFAAAQLWPLWLAVILGLGFEALLTGALHEDAVADFFDAFGGGWTRDDVLRILKDSRLGSFGALGLGFAVALRAATLIELEHLLPMALVVSAALGRWMGVVLMATLPAVSGRSGLAGDVGSGVGGMQAAVGGLLIAPAVGWLFWLKPLHGSAVAIALVTFLVLFRRLLQRRLGGTTGDCIGCFTYLCQLVVLLVLAAELPESAGAWPWDG